MASTSKNKKTTKKTTASKAAPQKATNGKRIMVLLSIFFGLTGLAFLLSFISYFSSGAYDQSTTGLFADRSVEVGNYLGKFGAYLSHLFIYEGFGVASFLFVKIIFTLTYYFSAPFSGKKLRGYLFWDLFAVLILSVAFGFFGKQNTYLGGTVGFELNDYLQHYLGFIGTLLLIVFSIVFYLIFRIRMAPERLTNFMKDGTNVFSKKISQAEERFSAEMQAIKKENDLEDAQIAADDLKTSTPVAVQNTPTPVVESNSVQKTVPQTPLQPVEKTTSIVMSTSPTAPLETTPTNTRSGTEEFIIETFEEETTPEDHLSQQLVKDFGEFDPTLELSNYQFPSVELLMEHTSKGITINQAELEENKNRIVETLNNYKIGIAQIKATVGPTVTLYEIIPEAGVRISKIKNLEDDIALSLAALGIRIIAPIPGKGTIGIEVPNTNPSVVSMKSLIASPKFQKAEMELPIALGKTISNETFVVDLAKMPHLLMAGATGQGKSVGLNAVLASLLYKKHPAEVKFVLVDPKKVELTLFNKIERHYLAKLPDTEDAIITDNTKVINTLNSLCIEMDNRYSLLKDAMVRNIKEYNEKFKQRKLNPENGHKFLPYIVLVVDEFADLIMTAGKEVETPIARLAQLARAIGIHLIIATQRPSVNVITGIIKANFPARIAFRVSSKIDSRTILDGPGADQLIGRGDLLYTQGNDMVRVQCGFVDTPEVEKITEFIGSQKAYASAYLLPEYVGEEGGTGLDIDIADRDSMFREAAEIIVTAQQGSASLLQRKLKLGYNRAGRIIDQLEAAGIVGPFEGSKARSVNIPDLVSLDEFFNRESQ